MSSTDQKVAFHAVVTQASPLMIREAGATTAVPAIPLGSYTTPAVGDSVAFVRYWGKQLLVLGKD